MKLTRGQQVRIQCADDDGPYRVTMTITHPGNSTGWIGVNFPYSSGATFAWILPDQILKAC
ncbi:hypothetical protein [Nocardia brasiliensis]|uniref:hypothetical protein n=1 Tax=Nocardia brasiliensis TaxID=37326 RepID=UPI002457C1C9|nr:hypothetical protein [Nocardia brasiliensis]